MCEINKISFFQETSFNMYNLQNSQIMLTHAHTHTLIYHILYKHFAVLACTRVRDGLGVWVVKIFQDTMEGLYRPFAFSCI